MFTRLLYSLHILTSFMSSIRITLCVIFWLSFSICILVHLHLSSSPIVLYLWLLNSMDFLLALKNNPLLARFIYHFNFPFLLAFFCLSSLETLSLCNLLKLFPLLWSWKSSICSFHHVSSKRVIFLYISSFDNDHHLQGIIPSKKALYTELV